MRPFFVCFVVAAAGLRSGFAPAYAQPATLSAQAQTAPVNLTPADTKTMASALGSLARQASVVFVVEGIPFRARESAPPLTAVAAKFSAKGVPLETAIEQIARAYDYDVERRGDIFLLQKRYTNLSDLPEVTTEDLRLALRDASRDASALPAPIDPPMDYVDPPGNTPFAEAFFKILSPTMQEEFRKRAAINHASVERSGLETQNGTIKVASLNEAQKNALLQCALTRYIQDATQKATDAYQALQTVERNGTLFSLAPTVRLLQRAKNARVHAKARRKKCLPRFCAKRRVVEGSADARRL